MKRVIELSILVTLLIFTGCNNKKERVATTESQPVAALDMNADTLNARIMDNIIQEVATRKSNIPEEALDVLSDTQKFLDLVQSGKQKEAIQFGHTLIGKLEVLLTKNPSIGFIPIDSDYKINELVTDIETVQRMIKEAKKAMKEGYYQEAQTILDNLHSEVEIDSYYLPTATYPDALKLAVAALEDNRADDAKEILQNVTGTVVIENTILPLPVLKAEQIIKEASKLNVKDQKDEERALNLLENAQYQLTLAEEMGYGKKDKEYKALLNDIKALEKSIKEKGETKNGFDSLKVRLKKFKNRLFPQGEQENRTEKTKQ